MSKSTTETTSAETKSAKLQKPAKAATPASSGKKPDIILNMLCRAKGASIKQLQEATGWQPHNLNLDHLYRDGRKQARLPAEFQNTGSL